MFLFLFSSPPAPSEAVRCTNKLPHRWLRAELEPPLNNKIKFKKRRRGKKTHPVLPGAPLVKGYGAVTLK